MENEKKESQSQDTNNEKPPQTTSSKMTMQELCAKRGIPSENTTHLHLGEIVVMPYHMQKSEEEKDNELNDSWGAFTRYANQRKGSGKK